MMAYDFAGPWTSRSGHQSQLFTPRHPTSDTARTSGQSAVDYLVAQGVPSTKIVLGIPATDVRSTELGNLVISSQVKAARRVCSNTAIYLALRQKSMSIVS